MAPSIPDRMRVILNHDPTAQLLSYYKQGNRWYKMVGEVKNSPEHNGSDDATSWYQGEIYNRTSIKKDSLQNLLDNFPIVSGDYNEAAYRIWKYDSTARPSFKINSSTGLATCSFDGRYGSTKVYSGNRAADDASEDYLAKCIEATVRQRDLLQYLLDYVTPV